MASDQQFWDCEEMFWIGGEEFYNSWLDPNCLMIFPKPTGFLRGDAIVDSLKHVPRWNSVIMMNKHIIRHGDHLVLLAYEARGDWQQEDKDYSALCGSVYKKTGDNWRLVHHQQTPLS